MTTPTPDLWYNFIRAHRCLIREIERRLAEENLPPYAWYDALWGIESGEDGARRMHELADVMAIERYNLTRLVDRLEKDGLVVRKKAADDGEVRSLASPTAVAIFASGCGRFTNSPSRSFFWRSSVMSNRGRLR